MFSYPQLATITGVQGVIIYAVTSALPLLIFSYLGPIIRKKTPDGFVLTEWVRQRYGVAVAIYLSFLTLATLFLYMVAELSALYQIVSTLTGMDGLPVIIVEVRKPRAMHRNLKTHLNRPASPLFTPVSLCFLPFQDLLGEELIPLFATNLFLFAGHRSFISITMVPPRQSLSSY